MSSPTAVPTADDCRRAARKLGDLFAQLPLAQDGQWQEIEVTARNLANGLRVKGGPVDSHTALGKTLLPQTLTSLLKSAIGESTPDPSRTAAVYEILRVGANLCMDHDDNRGFLLEAGFPQTVVSLLEGYTESIPSSRHRADPAPLSIPDLKLIKTAIGVLLNCSIDYEPVKSRLISLEAAITILRLSAAIYPPGSWMASQPSADSSDQEFLESWNLRSGLSSWAWRAISELREDNIQTFNPDVLPLIVSPLLTFVPPHGSPSGALAMPEASSTRRALLQADFESLEEVSSLIEALALDVEDIRLAFARSMNLDSTPDSLSSLGVLLDFIERGDYPSAWASDFSEEERFKKARAFDMFKSALIKAVVEVAGDEKNEDVLWEKGAGDDSFVGRMVSWIRKHKDLRTSDARDDLVICSTLSLGNILRREHHAVSLVEAPISIVPDLLSMLKPDSDIKVKHGVVGLLKQLSHTPRVRPSLGKAGVLQKLAQSQVWGEKSDIAEIVEASAIGVAKHLCTANAENACHLVLSSEGISPEETGAKQILALIRRSDTIAVKSEGTRVFVQVIKSLWSTEGGSGEMTERKQEARTALINPDVAAALAQLIGRSRKYPILINEGVVALTLLSMFPGGGKIVLDALLNPLPQEVNPRQSFAAKSLPSSSSNPTSASTTSAASSPAAGGPTRALDMLVTVLKTPESLPLIPVEVRANICSLLGQLGKKGKVSEEDDRTADVERVKSATREILESLARTSAAEGTSEKTGGIVGTAARKALDAWAEGPSNS
ncbi:hypothetical protein GLOTRDRAFT_136931 [Gloeophyllum trabeum ATCC 11539]|uniref:ARM repeat-containing protein n=1 Tax=Gloeophyllum trabeum (strain ATCC 11539 / FP-39264 / Madison 617) TaxID=670483 RepID=S7QEC3_GLOTA|nr:uncharacterized protein GLOTRDRAFT_136931 [Gloeophyllum trabeum ATCC 11539]EPQ58166.1 hypothetical protein GLOTRDRAFT_136931 [Gloeophyllum trabeum ATCC 11539]